MAYTINISPKVQDISDESFVSPSNYVIRCSNDNFKSAYSDKIIVVPGYNVIVIEGKNEYGGIIPLEVLSYIDPSKTSVDPIVNQTYSGNSIVPNIVVKLNGEQIRPSYPAKTIYFPNEDYPTFMKQFDQYDCWTLEYLDNIDVGTAHIRIIPTHTGDGVLPKDVYFQIVPYTIDGSKIAITGLKTSLYYKGRNVEQSEMNITFGGKTLTKDIDYTVEYFNNSSFGHASLNIVGINNFTGELNKSFDIYGSIQDATIIPIEDFAYDGTIKKPSNINVKLYNYDLVENLEYTVEYPGSDYVLPGTKHVVIHGIEDALMFYSKTFSYHVYTTMNNLQFIGPKSSYKYTGQQIKPGINVVFNSIILKPTIDYDLSYPSSDYSTIGQKIIELIGKNGYKGSKQITYYIYDDAGVSYTVAYKVDGTSFIISDNHLTRASFGLNDNRDMTLSKVVFGSNVESLSNNLFAKCIQLISVNMRACSDNIELPDGMFDGCLKLQSVIFPQQEQSSTYTRRLWAYNNHSFIDTECYATVDTIIEFTMRYYGNTSSSAFVGFNMPGLGSNVNGNYRFYIESQNSAALEIANHLWTWKSATPIFKEGTDYKIKLSYDGLYVNDVKRGNLQVNGDNTTVLKHTICIFGYEDEIVDFNIKNFSMTTNGHADLDLVPATDGDGIGCLVDQATNNKFYGMNGILECFDETPQTLTHEVIFDPDEGEIDGSYIRHIEHGKILGDMPRIVREGYKYQWIDEQTGEYITVNTIVFRNMIIVPKWIALTAFKYPSDDKVYYGDWSGIFGYSDIQYYKPSLYSPNEISVGDRITSLARNACKDVMALNRIVIRDNITSIPDSAFNNCRYMSEITLGNNISSIGSYSFFGCAKLQVIKLPNSLLNISKDAFKSSSLSNINLGELNNITSIGNSAFESCTRLSSVSWPHSVTSLNEYVFAYCNKLKRIDIPDEVSSIGKNAFDQCTSLSSIYCGNNLTSINSYAFYACSSLKSIIFNDNIQMIGFKAFNRCTALQYVKFGNSIATIGDKAFSECNSLQYVDFNDGVISVGNCAFWLCSSLSSIQFGNKLQSIDSCAFYQCSSLKSVEFGDSLATIGKESFSQCTSLTSIQFGNNISSIGENAFRICNLSNLTINSPKLKQISQYAFDYNINMVDAIIDGLYTDLSIEQCAFARCYNLSSIYIGKGTTSLFRNGHGDVLSTGLFNAECSSLVSVTLPFVGPTSEYADGVIGQVFGQIAIDAEVPNGSTCIIQKGNKYAFPSTLRNITILGNGSYNIPNNAFENVSMVSSIYFADGVTSIGQYAIVKCEGLQKVTIARSVETINSAAFVEPLPNLTCIAFEGRTIEDVMAIETYPFNLTDTSIISVELIS